MPRFVDNYDRSGPRFLNAPINFIATPFDFPDRCRVGPSAYRGEIVFSRHALVIFPRNNLFVLPSNRTAEFIAAPCRKHVCKKIFFWVRGLLFSSIHRFLFFLTYVVVPSASRSRETEDRRGEGGGGEGGLCQRAGRGRGRRGRRRGGRCDDDDDDGGSFLLGRNFLRSLSGRAQAEGGNKTNGNARR